MKTQSRFITSQITFIKRKKANIKYFENMIKIKERRNDPDSVKHYKEEIQRVNNELNTKK